jgi:hypothetical protein
MSIKSIKAIKSISLIDSTQSAKPAASDETIKITTTTKKTKTTKTTAHKYLCNAFSINMLQIFPAEIKIKEISSADASKLIASGEYKSAIGHASTAELLSSLLNLPVKVNRTTLMLNKNDELLLAQYYGERLPEGVVKLPDGSSIRWFLVVVK